MKKNLKVLILGGSGMLGHKVYQCLSKEFDTWVTFRHYNQEFKHLKRFNESKVIDNIDVFNFNNISELVKLTKPDIVLNCIGIIKQIKEAKNPKISIYVNSLFPHLLSELCLQNKSKVIHISTDCVFSGKKGMYTETDQADAEDLYGRTKFIGEINYSPGLTLRTSIIGHELFSNYSLVDWFLSNNKGKVNGFKNAIYSGLPTIIFATEIERIIKEYPDLYGLYQISSNSISKYELLTLIRNTYNLDIKIEADEKFKNNKSLICEKYIHKTNYKMLDWQYMVEKMYTDFKMCNYLGYKNV